MKKFIPIILILILGTFLRFYQIGQKNLWLDETASLYLAQKQFLPMIKEIVESDAHPPLYNTLLHLWIRGGKNITYPRNLSPRVITETRTRSLSALLGILTIFLTYRIGRLFFGEKTGLLASLIMATSSYQIFYAQEARLQTLVISLILFSLYFFYRGLNEKNKSPWLGFIISTTLSIYTFFYSFFIILVENLFFLIHFKRYRSSLRKLIISQAIILLLFSPWIPVLMQRIALVKSIPTATGFSLSAALLNTRLLLRDFTFGYPRFASPEWLTSLTLLLFLSLAIYGWRKHSRKDTSLLLLLWLFFPLLIVFSFPLKIHIFQSKYLIFSSPAYYLLLSGGLIKLKSRKVSGALLTMLILLNFASLRVYYLKNFIKEDWKEVAKYVEANSRDEDLILFDPPYLGFAFDYYYSGNLDRAGIPKEDFLKDIANLKTNYTGIWLIRDYSPVSRPSGTAQARLKEKYLEKDSQAFPGLNGHIIVNFYKESRK